MRRRRSGVGEDEGGGEAGKKEFIICPLQMQYPETWIILNHKY